VSGGATQNIILQQQQGAPAGTPNNRITSANGVGYAYDASGNLISDGAHSYQYDGEGRITTVDSGTGASYFYDSANRRVKKQQGGFTTYYVWEGSRVIAEYSDAPAGAGGTSYYLADRLSTRMATDTNGVMKGTQDHLPFGEDSGTSTGQVENHRFTNYERDSESNTDYAVNRQYSQNTGRFNRPDPITGSISSPQSLNRYSYVNNDPINATDPLGLEAVWGLYRGTFLGGGFGSGGADYAFWGDRIVDLPGFGTQWGSLSEFFEAQWNSRLRNTFDRAAASRAWNSGNYARVAAILNGNSNVGLSVGGTVYWGALGAAFATGYGDASLIAADSGFSLDNPVMAGAKAVLDLLKKLRKPDFFLVNVAVGVVQVSVSVLRGGKLPDNLVGSIGGATGTEISAFAGWLLQLTKPTNDEISSFLTGYSWSLDVFVWKGAIGAGVGFGYMRSPMNNGVHNAVLLGGGFGGGFAFGYGFTYNDLVNWLKP
jgi:RHS repeat-associated protein